MTRTARSLKFNPVVYTPKPGEPKWEYPVLRGTPPPMETIGPYDHSKDKRGIQLLKRTKNIAQAIGSIRVLKGDTSYKGDRRHEELAEPGDVDRHFPEGTTRTDILFQKKFINQLKNALKIGPDPTKTVDTGMPMVSPYHTPQGVQGWI